MTTHFRTASGTGKPLTLDAKSADRLAAEKFMRGQPKVPAHEQASFNTLQRQLAEAKLEQLHNQKHGNAQAQEQKSKAAGMVQSMNIHRSGK